jgi:hypothetical protein
MHGWRDSLDKARELLRTIDTPALPELWRAVQKLNGRASRQAWPFFQALEDFIPWDLAFSKHYRVRLRIPKRPLAAAKRLWPHEKIVFVVWSAVEQSGKRIPVTYYAPIEDGCCEVSLPAGDHFCNLASEIAAQGSAGETAHGGIIKLSVPLGLCHVMPSGAALVQEPSRYGKVLGSLFGQGKAGLPYASAAQPSGLSPAPLNTLG